MAEIAGMEPIWRCPVCEAGLRRTEAVYRCPAGHSFDVAREGYVNLVLAQHRRSPEAGDPKASVRSRRDFLEAGFYRPLAQALQEQVARLTSAPGATWLDAGCGEGYYLRRLAEALPAARLHGVDLAKEGVRLAARVSPGIDYAVGNTFRLPVRTAAVDGVLQVFAPSAPAEVRRVLRPAGWFVRVTPGPEHLAGFRARIYESAQAHAATAVPAGFVEQDRQRVRFPLRLEGAETVAQLVEMTPYKWHMNPEVAADVARWTRLEDTADVVVSVAAVQGAST